DKEAFDEAVRHSLRRHVDAINTLTERGMYFWDYGNAFLFEAARAGAEVEDAGTPSGFRYPSYVEDIMGPLCFDFGFGPFRWVCSSGEHRDLEVTDHLAAETLRELLHAAPESTRHQLADNLKWIEEAATHIPTVGSQSRILYADAYGRQLIARRFNEAI